MQLFLILKFIHQSAVLLTICSFSLRGFWMMTGSPLLETRLARTAPHFIDTILLISAVSAAALLGQYPFVDGWLTAKVLGLLSYIVLGAIALTYGRTRGVKVGAFVGAILSFAYVVYVAFTKNPMII